MITADEKAALEAKLAALIANRPIISRRIAEARELGDLRENADYHAAREEQGMQEASIRQLTERLSNVQVVDDSHKATGMVFVGAIVRVVEVRVDDTGMVEEIDEVETVRIVGESSGAAVADIIEATVNSPFGAALDKARVGDIVAVKGPRGTKRFRVQEIL
ncbi:MAG TPA: GreA/GreB family elongation factor [Phycisphaerales bacterium]|jgi:transcription elongation factor GreA|nr:GreA/GreB family elongation factor [Phycisphaerales bacterium]